MNHETDLRTAIAYLADLDGEIEERSTAPALSANPAAREDMLYQLRHARELVAGLERQASSISCISYLDGWEVLLDLDRVRTWCRAVEAKIMRICCNESAAAAA